MRINISADAPDDAFDENDKLTEEYYGTVMDVLMAQGCEDINISEG